MDKYNELISAAGLSFFEDHGACESCVGDLRVCNPCTCDEQLAVQLGIMSQCGLIRQPNGMTEQEEFKHNKAIAESAGLLASVIEYGQEDEFIGVVYFLNTKHDDLRDQKHFAHHLDFINDKARSEFIYKKLLGYIGAFK